MPVSLITPDDFYAFSMAIKKHGWKFLANKLKFKGAARVKAQWDTYQSAGTNWWDISMVRDRWNQKITGNEKYDWEHYVVEKYVSNRQNLSMLSIGCGTGEKERVFAKFSQFSAIVGMDVSEKSIQKAREISRQNQYSTISYRADDFTKANFGQEKFDFVLFYSSLHHFRNIEALLQNNVIPVLKSGGLVIVFEYTGPNRFQYSINQLEEANRCLSLLPASLKIRTDHTVKWKIYRPGLLRTILNDPSEAPCSESILPSLRKWLMPLEEKPVGGAILHMLLKDIAHHFTDTSNSEAVKYLGTLFQEEDAFYEKTGQSDFWFGVYGQKELGNSCKS